MSEEEPRELRCWFCAKGDCDAFSTEFDCYLHLSCLESQPAQNPEAEIMARELGVHLVE